MADAAEALNDLDIVIDTNAPTITVDPDNGTVEERQPDGGVIVRLDAKRSAGLGAAPEDWFRNLVDEVPALMLSGLTNELIDGIKADDQSRQPSLQSAARGLDLLGLELNQPSSDVSTTNGVPGLSKVTNPLLLEACLKGWANAQAELLPASGPAKIVSDGNESSIQDTRAESLERGFNHYLTTTATEYYPDTSQMLLWGVYFRGSGFKKVYRCPMRRRPVSESVEAKDLIVSDASKDLRSCGRITHQISMRPSVFRRMQLIGAYRKTGGVQPNPETNPVDEKVASIQGMSAIPDRPEDKPHTIWETQCELDLDEFIPAGSKFKGEGIPLPFLVTIDKDNQEILAIRRDWAEDDKDCNRQRMYVRYYYVPGPGFYCTGMLNIIGNSSAALTAAWREALDAGQFANFPAGFMAKLGGRQIGTDFQLSPGQFQLIETNGLPIGNIITKLPYGDVTAGLLSLIDKITEQSKSLAQGAEMPAAEGLQNVPVGTMLAQIEQATKVMSAAHKGMHQSQSEEIDLLLALFRRHPQDFLDGNPEADQWQDQQELLDALNDLKLTPKSDPNVPSHIHRVAKALGLVQLAGNPDFKARLNLDEVLTRVLNAMREDPKGLQVPAPPPQAGADPEQVKADAKITEAKIKAASKAQELAADKDLHDTDLAKEVVIHQSDTAKVVASEQKDKLALVAKASLDHAKFQHDRTVDDRKHVLESANLGLAAADQHHQHQMGIADHVLEAGKAAHSAKMETEQALNPQPTTPKKGP